MKTIGQLICCIFISTLFLGCATAKVTMFGNSFPPKDTDAPIDVYMTNRPSQEYIEIAQIKCADTNDKWSLQQIQNKAREIGADAIIITGRTGSSGVGTPIGNMTYVSSEEYGMTSVAIKYKK